MLRFTNKPVQLFNGSWREKKVKYLTKPRERVIWNWVIIKKKKLQYYIPRFEGSSGG